MLAEIKWIAKDECLESSMDSLYEVIPTSSSCSLATFDTFQASFWPLVCFSPFLSSCFHNHIIKSQNKCSLSILGMGHPQM